MRTSSGCWGHVDGRNLVVAAVQAVVVVVVHVHLDDYFTLEPTTYISSFLKEIK